MTGRNYAQILVNQTFKLIDLQIALNFVFWNIWEPCNRKFNSFFYLKMMHKPYTFYFISSSVIKG